MNFTVMNLMYIARTSLSAGTMQRNAGGPGAVICQWEAIRGGRELEEQSNSKNTSSGVNSIQFSEHMFLVSYLKYNE